MLARTTGRAGPSWHLEPDETGKLHAFDGRRQRGPAVSIAHSRDWVAAAVSHVGPVGIDVEVVRPDRALAQIADLAFGPNERAWVARDGEAAFYPIWTLREAMAKASGAGLAEAADGRDRVAVRPGAGSWAGNSAGANWLLHHIKPAEAVHLAVAVAVTESSEPVENWWDTQNDRLDIGFEPSDYDLETELFARESWES
jgi:phosphopantetheinyl transferase